MANFVTQTNDLIAKMENVLAADSTAEWAMRLNKIKAELNKWRQDFTILTEPSPEQYEAVIRYTTKLTEVLARGASYQDTAPAAGGRRHTRRYCKKTPCRKMGFTQKASCRPYKNCYSTRS